MAVTVIGGLLFLAVFWCAQMVFPEWSTFHGSGLALLDRPETTRRAHPLLDGVLPGLGFLASNWPWTSLSAMSFTIGVCWIRGRGAVPAGDHPGVSR